MGKRFPESCEKIIFGIKRSNKSRPENNQLNPFAIALSNKQCKSDFRKIHWGKTK